MRQLSPIDAGMLYRETPSSPCHVTAVDLYDPSTAPGGHVTFDQVLESFRRRLPLARPFREKLVRVPLELDLPYWVNDPDFDLEFHVRHVAVPRPGEWTQLRDLLARLVARPLDLARPPWEVTMIDGIDSIPGVPPGGFALVIKAHHAVVDGVAGLELLTAIHDGSADAVLGDTPDGWEPERTPSPVELLARASSQMVKMPARLAKVGRKVVPRMAETVLGMQRGDIAAPTLALPRTRFNAPISPHRSIEARRYPLDDFKRIKKAVDGATINDVTLSVMGGTLRRYLASKGELPDTSLAATVPMSIRSDEHDGGNQVATITVDLRTDIADPMERLEKVSLGARAAKGRKEALGARTLLDIAELVPGRLLGLGFLAVTSTANRAGTALLVNAIVTNVPGPQMPLYFCGAQQVAMLGFAPVFDSLGLTITITSYCGEISFAIASCRNMIPDPAFFARCLDESVEELLAYAG